VANNKSIFLMS